MEEAAHSLEALRLLCASGRQFPLREASAQVFQGRSKILDSREAVSYTHLDVYKRQIYTSLFSDGTAVKISFHEPRQMGWQGNGPMGSTGWLAGSRRLLSQTEPTLKDIRRRLAQVDCSSGVALYDVGQGACQAGLESFLHLPALYIDFGGGVRFAPMRTRRLI